MGFGPSWSERDATGRAAQETDEMLSRVRTAAEKLVDDLAAAERLTRHWSHQELTEALVDAALSQCLGELAGTGCWGEANRLPSGELWQIAGPLLEVGTLQYCARFKPHGYAGDYEMLARICEDYCCEDPLGRAFDRYFQRQAAPQAVRSRTEQTAAALASDCLKRQRNAYHVVSVGSGPAIDVRGALGLLSQQRRTDLRVSLLDLDPNALDFARGLVEPLLPPGALRCVRTNLFRLAQGSDAAAALDGPDFLICSGLFDYLADEPAASMLRFFWGELSADGLLLVGNFSPHNPTRAYMEWIGNWYLTYRSAEQMEQLGVRAGIPPEQFTIGCERLGVDLFLIGRRR